MSFAKKLRPWVIIAEQTLRVKMECWLIPLVDSHLLLAGIARFFRDPLYFGFLSGGPFPFQLSPFEIFLDTKFIHHVICGFMLGAENDHIDDISMGAWHFERYRRFSVE
jgi:hypothetical protein